jgi:hypothetical protein
MNSPAVLVVVGIVSKELGSIAARYTATRIVGEAPTRRPEMSAFGI